MTIKIRKRQGYLVNYDREQLYHSISPVVQTAKEQSQVVCYCDSKIKALDGIKQHLSIEELLDLVQNSLLELNLKDEAARFASYREERKRVREAKKIKVDVESTIEDYVGQLDWRVNENANQGYSIGGMILNTSGKVTANYWLSSVYPERVGQAHRDGRIHIHDLSFLGCYCLAGSTKIRLLDGRVKSIKWLAENMQNEEFEVMSYDLDKMEPAVGTAYKPRLTRKHAETITLVLDNGKKLTCTPDHKILTRDGVYVEAGNLHIGDSLMPMNIKMNPLFRRLSISTYSVARKKPVRGQLHRVIFELANRKLKKNEIVHHINGNKFDNRTCNLQAMDDSEHRAMEFTKTNSRPDVKAKYSALLSAYNKSDEKRKLASKFAKSRKRDAEGRFVNIHNHKVVAIKKGTTQDVYCMTVKNYHNFAIDAGIVVKNCCGWDLKRLLDEGLNGLKGHIDSKPPKNLSGAVGQMVNALGVLQNEAAGAQAYSSADTYLAPFVRELKKKIINEYTDVIGMTGGTVDVNINADRLKAYVDEKLHKEVYQCIQELIFNLNVPSRWGSQTPFTNLTFDLTCPEDLKDRKPKIGGVEVEDYTYGDLQEEMNLLNNVFVEVYMKGDAKGQPFTFPIPTYNITKDFDWNSKFVDSVFEMAAKYGLPYFQNFMSSDMKPSDVRSMCCRLRLDKRELLKRGNGLFGSAEQTGSIGVVTINLARLGYKHKGDLEGLYQELDELLIIAKDSLEIKRAIVSKLLEQGFYPALSRYLSHFNNHFSTIGINGGNEMIRNFTNDEEDISTEYGQKMMLDMMDYLRQRMADFQEETGNLYNLEAAPCEGAMYRFALADKKAFGDDIIQAGPKEAPYYTNSSQLPVSFTDDIFEALDLQNDLQCKYTGGTVLHLYMAERVSSADVAKTLVRKIFENYTLPYITFTPTFSICPIHGYLAGEHEYCPICDAEIEKRAQASCNCETEKTI